MGHVPSKSLSREPFIVDMETSRGHVDSVAAFALTTDNFPQQDHPLFQQFQEVRCDAPVLFWYCAPPTGGDLPPPPPIDTTFTKRFVDSQHIVNMNLPPNEFIPLPIMLVRLKGKHQSTATGGPTTTKTATSSDDEDTTDGEASVNSKHMACGLDTEGATVIGYFGCRSFGAQGAMGTRSIVGIFLNKQFFNDAKSIAIISIACKAYKHFCIKAGCRPDAIPWPTEIEFDTQQYNLPCLRLIQKIYQCYVKHHLPAEIQNRVQSLTLAEVASGEKRPPQVFNFQYVNLKMYAMCIDMKVIAKVCEQLASEVLERERLPISSSSSSPAEGGAEREQRAEPQWVMKAAVLPPFNGVSAGVLDELVEIAKSKWRLANEPVIRQQLKTKLHNPQKDKLLKHQHPVPATSADGAKTEPGAGGEKKNKKKKSKKEKSQASDSSSSVVPRKEEEGAPSTSSSTGPSGTEAPPQPPVLPAPITVNVAKNAASSSKPANSEGSTSGNPKAQQSTSPSLLTTPSSATQPPNIMQPVARSRSNVSINSSLAGVTLTHAPPQYGWGFAPSDTTSVCASHGTSRRASGDLSVANSPVTLPPPVAGSQQQPQQPASPPLLQHAPNTQSPGTFSQQQQQQTNYQQQQVQVVGGSPRPAHVSNVQPQLSRQNDFLYNGELFVGDLAPIFICNAARQWIPVYWNESKLIPLRRSMYQLGPDVQDHVCYDLSRPVWVVDNQGNRFMTEDSQPYVFMEKGIVLHAFVNGGYVAVPAE